MAKGDTFGYVYILSNPEMHGLVKIGMIEREKDTDGLLDEIMK